MTKEAKPVAVRVVCPDCGHLFMEELVRGWQPPAWGEWFADQLVDFQDRHRCPKRESKRTAAGDLKFHVTCDEPGCKARRPVRLDVTPDTPDLRLIEAARSDPNFIVPRGWVTVPALPHDERIMRYAYCPKHRERASP